VRVARHAATHSDSAVRPAPVIGNSGAAVRDRGFDVALQEARAFQVAQHRIQALCLPLSTPSPLRSRVLAI
jgi:hypothetical protein